MTVKREVGFSLHKLCSLNCIVFDVPGNWAMGEVDLAKESEELEESSVSFQFCGPGKSELIGF